METTERFVSLHWLYNSQHDAIRRCAYLAYTISPNLYKPVSSKSGLNNFIAYSMAYFVVYVCVVEMYLVIA